MNNKIFFYAFLSVASNTILGMDGAKNADELKVILYNANNKAITYKVALYSALQFPVKDLSEWRGHVAIKAHLDHNSNRYQETITLTIAKDEKNKSIIPTLSDTKIQKDSEGFLQNKNVLMSLGNWCAKNNGLNSGQNTEDIGIMLTNCANDQDRIVVKLNSDNIKNALLELSQLNQNSYQLDLFNAGALFVMAGVVVVTFALLINGTYKPI